jgi:hypothetical protein
MDCVCVPFRGWISKTNDLITFEQGMVVGARLTGLCLELHRYWVFHTRQFSVCIKNGPPPKWHPAILTQLCEALESTWASIPMERFRHLVESIPRQIEVVVRAKVAGGFNIMKMFLMFCRHRHTSTHTQLIIPLIEHLVSWSAYGHSLCFLYSCDTFNCIHSESVKCK